MTRIGLNLIYLVPGETGGTETYACELIRALVDAASDIQFTAFVSREAAATTDAPWKNLIPSVEVPVNAANRLEWVRGEQLQLPRLAAGARVDLVHSLANTAPLRGRFRRVVTIHDLHHRLVPEAHLGMLATGMRVLVSAAARRSDRIITPSATTAADVQRLLHIKSSKIDVVPEGIGAEQRVAPAPEADVRGWLGAGDRPIVLSVSAKRPHKNLARLISAVADIPPERRPLLVVPGYSTPYEHELQRQVAALGIEEDIRLIGWIEPERLEGLYAAATCLVCASLHEGFGLPVLESMLLGTPVLSSTEGSLPEVAGDATLLVDPYDPLAIRRGIVALDQDADLRAELIRRGALQAAKYSPAAYRTRLAELYQPFG